jgi:hypothetical protein
MPSIAVSQFAGAAAKHERMKCYSDQESCLTEKHPQSLEPRRRRHGADLCGSGDLVFGNEDQIARAPSAFKQVFERFTDDGFAMGTRNLAQVLEVIEILLN